MGHQYTVKGRTWVVEPSFFAGCIDLISGEEVITVAETADAGDILELLHTQ